MEDVNIRFTLAWYKQEIPEKAIHRTVNKVSSEQVEVGFSSSFTVEENYFRPLAKNHTRGGNLKS